MMKRMVTYLVSSSRDGTECFLVFFLRGILTHNEKSNREVSGLEKVQGAGHHNI
jgi:hypothetical protein